MSRYETSMILRFWETIGGTLVEEFPVIKGSSTCGRRWLDAVILPKGEFRRMPKHERDKISLEGQNIIVVQAKASRLGMSLMGQAIFSAELIKRFKPTSIRSIALCKTDDSELRPLLAPFPHVEVIVLEDTKG